MRLHWLQVYTRELENAFERTSQPLTVAVECLDRHHHRLDYDQLRLDEVEDTLCEVCIDADATQCQRTTVCSYLVVKRDDCWCCTSFLSRVNILTRDIDIAHLSVCLSVRPSVTFRYWMKMA